MAATPAQAALAGVGPVSADHGFPEWYDDGTVRLALCIDPADGCLAAPPDPAAPISYPGNFPGESFWFAAGATGGSLRVYEAALEAAHTTPEATPGEQIAFARLRFRLNGLVGGASYTITHPYGVNTFEADATGVINVTIDEGMCAPAPGAPCDFTLARDAFLGDYGGTATTTGFIRQIGAEAGTIGSATIARPVTGAPSGNNFVEVVGPNAGGEGVNILTVNDFTVQGLISEIVDGAPSTPDLTAASDTGLSSTDNITAATRPTFTGTATAGSTVSLMVDGATTPAASGTAPASGAYSIALTSALAAGNHTIQARITDPAFATDPTAPEFLTSLTLSFVVESPVTKDFTGDGNPDVVARDSAGQLLLYPGNGQGGFGVKYLFGTGWGGMTAILTPGDFNGDGRADVIARNSAGNLFLYAGNAQGRLNAGVQIGNGWNSMTALVTPGDFNGDGNADLLARDSAGNLYLYPGNGSGGFGARTLNGTGWNPMNAIVGVGDFNGDGRADVMARAASNGVLYLYTGNGTGGFAGRIQVGTGWSGMNPLVGPGEFNADANADLLARDSVGRLWMYPGAGTGFFAPRVQVGSGWQNLLIVQ